MTEIILDKIQIKRGLKVNLPTLDEGEPAYCTDTKEYFIGTSTGNVLINGGGSGEVGALVFETLLELQNALPSGSTQPVWVNSEQNWYYWDGIAPADTTAPILTVAPNGGIFASSQSVTMTTNETADIYYTLDGSTPTTISAKYTAALSLSETTTLKAFAKDTAGNVSAIQTITYTKDMTAPSDTTAPVLTVTPAATFADTQTVTMSTNETATIYFTLDDTDPKTSGTKQTYTAPLTLTATDTVKAYAKDTAGNDSIVQTVTYTKQAPADTTAPVLTITPASTFTDTKTVTMSTNETSTIYYTLDDTDPTVSGTKQTYSGAITLTETDTIKAYAKDTAGNDSAVQTVTYTKEVVDPNRVLYSSFNGADSATAFPVAETGQSWTALAGVWGITANKAYNVSGANAMTVIDAGITDVDISTEITWGSEGALVLRSQDASNYLFLRLKTNQVQFYEMVAGIGTMTYSAATTLVSGQVYTLRAVLRGSEITCYLDGTKVFDAYSTRYTNATKFGFRQSALSTDKYDNFTINQLTALTLTDYVAYDSFDRADSATSLGVAEKGGTWSQLVDVWGITNKKAYAVQDTSAVTSSDAVAVIDSGISNCIIEVIDNFGVSTQARGATFRVLDADNYWAFRHSSGEWQLVKFTGGTYTKITFVTESINYTKKIKVVINGSSIECFVNGVSKLTATDAFNQTATKHGLYGAISAEFDNFSIKNIV